MTLVKPMKSGDLNGLLHNVKLPCWASPKLDGYRATVQPFDPDDTGVATRPTVLSNTLKPIRNQFVQAVLQDTRLLGLDGELIVGDPADDPFNRTSSGVTSMAGEPDFKLYVFDNCTAQGGFTDRYTRAKRAVNSLPAKLRKYVVMVEHRWITTLVELADFEMECVQAGYEGIMTRSPDGPYKQGRSTVREGWLCKLKRFSDAEAIVIGVEEQMRNTNEAKRDALGHTERSHKKAGLVGKGVLGALQVKGVNGDFKGKLFSIGTGFNDEQRAALWAEAGGATNGLGLNGRLVKYKFFPTGSKDAPRFPVFLGWRDKADLS